MKFGFGLRIGITVGIVLLACAYLGMGYAGAISDYDASRGQMNMTLEVLNKSSAQQAGKNPADIQAKIDGIIAELRRVQSIYPSALDKTRTISVLLDIAESNGIAVSVVSCSEGTKKTEERIYPVITLGLEMEGSYNRILDFLSDIEGVQPESRQKWLTSMAIDSVNLLAKATQPEKLTDGAAEITIGGVPLSDTDQKYEGRVVVMVYGMPEPIPKKTPAASPATQSKAK
jgi:Tfp pilus assembly protein PilO